MDITTEDKIEYKKRCQAYLASLDENEPDISWYQQELKEMKLYRKKVYSHMVKIDSMLQDARYPGRRRIISGDIQECPVRPTHPELRCRRRVSFERRLDQPEVALAGRGGAGVRRPSEQAARGCRPRWRSRRRRPVRPSAPPARCAA